MQEWCSDIFCRLKQRYARYVTFVILFLWSFHITFRWFWSKTNMRKKKKRFSVLLLAHVASGASHKNVSAQMSKMDRTYNLLCLIALIRFDVFVFPGFFSVDPNDKWDVNDNNWPGVRWLWMLGEQLTKSDISKSLLRSILLKPKSVSLTWPVADSNILSGFMSRWTMPWLCRYCRANVISAQ